MIGRDVAYCDNTSKNKQRMWHIKGRWGNDSWSLAGVHERSQ